MPQEPVAAGLYLHFPFCSVRCTYCDFPTVAGRDEEIEAYLAALGKELASFQLDLPRLADTVYLGGGTPSRMSGEQVAWLLGTVRARFDLAPGAEITLEGNPESLTRERLCGYREAGVTRISVGVQSFDDSVLAAVGRAHGSAEAEAAVNRAREAGFPDVSVDLIAGLPGEDAAGWRCAVLRAARLGPDHVSVYLLETDKDTPLGRSVRASRVFVADDDLLADAYEESVAALEESGFSLYEISNFARDGHVSRHNLKYWTDAPYGGFGLGAHAYSSGERRANRRDLSGYLSDLAGGRDPLEWKDPFDPERRMQEALFLGLRVASGVDLESVSERYGIDARRRYDEAWSRAADAGLVEWSGARIRLTPRGRVRSNELFADLV
jgi:oxygen-independent coproporphyrinogen-3 oxidase